MIASLKGKIEIKDSPFVVINVGGVGYKVFVSPKLFSSLTLGENASVFTYAHIRDDMFDLYGFSEFSDLKLFEYLIGVSGVGPKTAIGIFASGTRSEIIDAILKGDVDFFTSVPRLGRKNAQKIIIELKNKFGDGADLDLTSKDGSGRDEVVMALKSFGFTQSESIDALRNLDKKLTTEQKIKQALKYLGK